MQQLLVIEVKQVSQFGGDFIFLFGGELFLISERDHLPDGVLTIFRCIQGYVFLHSDGRKAVQNRCAPLPQHVRTN